MLIIRILVTEFCVGLVLTMCGLAVSAQAAEAGVSAVLNAAPQFIERAASADVLQQLRQGGFVLYLRHAATDNSKPDRLPAVDLKDCTTQRPLSDMGRAQAVRIGQAMRAARIPIYRIHVSPLCRGKDTAAAAFPGRTVEVDLMLIYTSYLTDAQKAPIVANTRRLLSEPVAAGSNRLVIAHGPNLMDLMGYFPREGTLVLFRPRGEAGFDYVASIPPYLWTELPPPGVLR